MDLTSLDVKSAADAGATLTLKNPFTQEDMEGAEIDLIGRDSPRVEAKMQELDRAKVRGASMDEKERSIELFCAVTVGWRGIEFDGQPLDFSPENARKLYTDSRTEWIGEQVAPFVLSRRNFAKNSSGT